MEPQSTLIYVHAAFLLRLTAACILLTNCQLQQPYPLLIAVEDKLTSQPCAGRSPTISRQNHAG
jgi:hypothetical protein